MNIPALQCVYCGKTFRTTEEDRDFCYDLNCEEAAFYGEYEDDDEEDIEDDY